jgi:DNA-directed RNA polymerase specialized sigma24 family protein
MITRTELTQDNFDGLLLWLAPDRDAAGVIYERIRFRLVRYFEIRGCDDPLVLADESIGRVASKFTTLRPVDRPERVFFGFASKIHLEYLTRWKNREVELSNGIEIRAYDEAPDEDPELEESHECLDRCLSKLSGDDCELMVRYYSEEKTARINNRKSVAEELDISMAALHTKIYRLRNVLKECIQECLSAK